MMINPCTAPFKYSLIEVVKFKTLPMSESMIAPTTVPHWILEP